MSEYVTFHSMDRIPVRVGPEEGAAAGADDQTKAFQAGFEAGLMAAREQDALRPEITAGGGDLVGGTRNDVLTAGDPLGMGYSGTGGGIGNDPHARDLYFQGMQSSRDPFGMASLDMNPFGFPSATPTGRPSFDMTGMSGFGRDPVAGALQQLNQLMQLLTLVAQLEMLVSELQGDRGGPSDLMTPIGMPGGNDFMRGGPGSDRLAPRMTILPFDPSGEVRGGNPGVIPGAAPDAPLSPVRDPLDDWYVEGQGDLSERQLANIEAVMTGRGAITLSTDPMRNETDFVQGLYPFDETRDLLGIIERDGMHGDLHDEAMWWLSEYGASQNGLDAAETLFALEGDDFTNAYMDLMRTPMAEQLGAALRGVAGRQLLKEQDPSAEQVFEEGDIGEPELYTEASDDFEAEAA